jgi:hypothetical protein
VVDDQAGQARVRANGLLVKSRIQLSAVSYQKAVSAKPLRPLTTESPSRDQRAEAELIDVEDV